MKRPPFSIASILVFFFFLLIAGVMFYRVVLLAKYVPFHHWDEAIYAEVTKEWVRHPSLVLTYNAQNWFEKPPLITLLTANAWIISPNKPEFYARFMSMVQSLVVLMLLFVVSYKVTKSRTLSSLAVLITTSSFLYQDRSSLLNVDITLALGWVLYIWAVQKDSVPIRFIGTFIGVLSKSFLGLVPLSAEFAMDAITRTLTIKKSVRYTLILAASLVWHVFMIISFGNPFVQSHFIDHMLSRVARPIELHFGDKFFYLIKLWGETSLFSILAALTMAIVLVSLLISIFSKKNNSKQVQEKSIILSTLIFLEYLTLLTVSKSKIHWYLTPLVPLTGLLAIYGIYWISNKTKNTFIVKGVLIVTSLFVAILAYRFFTTAPVVQKEWYVPSDKTQIGQCVGKNKRTKDRLVYLVPPQERIDAHVIEAANLQIGSSFIYGSAPAFLFYADVPVHFVYKTEDLSPALATKPTILVMDISDLAEPDIHTKLIQQFPHFSKTSPLCTASQMAAFRL